MADIVNTVIDKAAFEQVDQLAQKLEKARLELVELIGTAQNGGNSFRSIQLPKDLDTHLKKIASQRKEITKATESERVAELELQAAREKAFADYEKRLQRERAAREKQVKAESDLRQRLARQKEQEHKREIAMAQRKAREDVQQVENQKILGRNARELAKLNSTLTTAYEKKTVVLERMRRKYKDVAISQGENSQEARRLQAEIQKLDQQLKRVDANVGQFQRNVGNYSKAWRSLGGVIRSTAAAFGLMGGAFMAVGILRDGITRIREFDKEMQNLAGIVGTSRSELEGLEQTIIDVAGQSVKTSNEVAKMATALISLGKTPREVQLLLKPVNDLGIALQATSDEAGELLIQTLNAFGKGAESGDEFANIIAKVRSSTALDFQRINDSLSYVSSTASALGLDLARTASILGVLNDNGIKAARAGRLMNSTFGRLNQSGLTLNQALSQINEATDKVATATELFGTESFSLGLILADNTDKMDEYTETFRNADGALDALVNEQMKSMDAHIRILDSAWEKFVLTFDNGTGVLSRGINRVLTTLTAFVDTLSMMNDDGTLQGQAIYNKTLQRQAEYYNELGEEAAEYAKIDKERSEEALRIAERDLKRLEAIYASLEANAENIGFGRAKTQMKEVAESMSDLRIQIGRLKGEQDAANAVLDEGTNSLDELGDQVEKADKILKGSIAYYEKLIKELKEKRDNLSTTREEYKKYTREIERAEEAIKKLTEGQKELVKYFGEGTEAGNFETELNINAFQQHLRDRAKAEVDIEKVKQKEIVFLRKLGLERYIELNNDQLKEVRTAMELELELHKEFEQAKQDVIFESINAIGEARVNAVDREIEANRRKYAEILDNEHLSEEQRLAMEARREAEEQRLEEKRRKREKEAFLIRQGLAVAEIAINLAKTIAAINAAAAAIDMITFGIGGQAYRAANIPIAIGTAAAQTGVVLAQTIPQFKHGHMSGTHEGLAQVNDAPGSNYKEVIEDRKGNIMFPQERNQIIHMARGTKVYKNYDQFLEKKKIDAVVSASILGSLANQGRQLSAAEFNNKMDMVMMREMINQGIKEGFQNIQINNRINNNNSALLTELKRQRRRDV